MSEQNNAQSNEPIQSLKSIWIVALLIILTALIVGGGIYWWQKTLLQAEQKKFQQEVVLLNDQLKLTQKENIGLSEQITELKSKNETTIDDQISNIGWKKFSSGDKSSYVTENWSSYSDIKDNFSFSLEYPGEWQLSGGVFNDSSGNKIAELLPGLVVLSPNQKCFDVSEEENERSRLISKTSINIGGKTGVLKIDETGTEVGIWYPNIFCLSEGKMAFVMSFYEHELGAGDRKLFEKILATLKFE